MRLALRLIVLALGLPTLLVRGGEAAVARFSRVDVAPTWTSIYVGTVSLTMPAFSRTPAGDFESTYVARVFPYFFYNEQGRISIRLSDETLRKLERGEAIEFSGRAVSQEGAERQVEGRATPSAATGGKIKVRVRLSSKVELIFNTTYRFPGN